MIVQPDEVDAFEAFLDDYEDKTAWVRALHLGIRKNSGQFSANEFVASVFSHISPEQFRHGLECSGGIDPYAIFFKYLYSNPHLLIPLGFDEIRIERTQAEQLASAFNKEMKKHGWTSEVDASFRLPNHESFEVMLGLHCRQLSSGIWYQGVALDLTENSLQFRSTVQGASLKVSLREIVACCRTALQGDSYPSVLLLPNLWHSPSTTPSIQIADATRDIVMALSQGYMTLQDLTWRQLEELVAELLRSRGLEVKVTPRSGDGGRDIIARGELIPGETVLLAVEVKHRPVVKVSDVRSALYANQNFPMLLVATSGKFTAGVVKEKKRPDNFLRLHLRDGLALQSWINDYV